MKFLDLFCCCGGISKGFNNTFPNSEITGIDITNNHKYPYNFIHKDIFDLPLSFFEQFDLIHASPPCQHYFYGINQEHRNDFPDLVDKTRQLLLKIGKPFTLENIPNSPLRKDLILCGEMFDLRVIRHRIFEIHGFTIPQLKHKQHKKPIDKKHSWYAQIAGNGGNSYSYRIEDWQKAMDINWVNDRKHLTQMIPPKYYEYISKFLVEN